MSLGGGCALEVGRYALVALLYVGVLRFWFPGGSTTLAALGLAVFATFLASALQRALIPSPDRRAVRRARAGVPPAHGARVAMTGGLVPTGPALITPFSREPCVAYSYWIGRRVRSNEVGPTLEKDFRGFALAPCALRTVLGDVRLRGITLADLEALDEDPLRLEDARPDVREYLSETSFEPDPGHQLETFASGLKQALAEIAEPPLAARKDYGDPSLPLAPDHILSEKSLREGETLTAIGRFDATGPELGPKGVEVLVVLRGDLEQARRALGTNATSALVMALAMFLVAHAMLAVAIEGGAFE